MTDSFYADENYSFELTPTPASLGTQLRLFHNSFNSSIRAILQDCLFRVHNRKGNLTFQILCPNQAVVKRLSPKQEKICATVSRIWGNTIIRVELCLETAGKIQTVVTFAC